MGQLNHRVKLKRWVIEQFLAWSHLLSAVLILYLIIKMSRFIVLVEGFLINLRPLS